MEIDQPLPHGTIPKEIVRDLALLNPWTNHEQPFCRFCWNNEPNHRENCVYQRAYSYMKDRR